MDDKEKETEKRIREAWEEAPDVQPEGKIEASWEDFAAKTFDRKKRAPKRWHYAAAMVVIFLSISGLWIFQTSPFGHTYAGHLNIIENPADQSKTIYLPDSSLVELEPNSTLEFSDDFRENRKIRLKGNAFFRVAKDRSHPFQVSCNTTTTTVLGTEFTIAENIDEAVSIQLYEGSIQLNVKDSTHNWILSPGEKFVYGSKNLTVTTFNRFEDFKDRPLKEVITYLQSSYGYKILFPKELLQKQVTLRVRKKEQLSNITKIFSEIYNLNPHIDEDLKEITFK
ncbi:FecR family protein [Flagellimonas aurea]|uniref:FecR family protein n=1 Tax=Flagellimonas aurea TaxID=2915619 RepID=UPI0035CECCA1